MRQSTWQSGFLKKRAAVTELLGLLLDVTGCNFDAPTYGANFAVFFISHDVTDDELNSYVRQVLSSKWDN
ncbi:MAG: hypothetical protein ACJ8C4_01785 [Gemmataceae bacterium]